MARLNGHVLQARSGLPWRSALDALARVKRLAAQREWL